MKIPKWLLDGIQIIILVFVFSLVATSCILMYFLPKQAIQLIEIEGINYLPPAYQEMENENVAFYINGFVDGFLSILGVVISCLLAKKLYVNYVKDKQEDQKNENINNS